MDAYAEVHPKVEQTSHAKSGPFRLVMGKAASTAIKLGLGAAILLAIAFSLNVDAVVHTLLSVAPYAIAVGFAIVLLQTLVGAGRLSAVVGLYGRHLPVGAALRVSLEGMFFGQTFVSFLGGDALRIWRIRGCGLPLHDATAAVALDRVIGTIMNHALVLASLPWLLDVIVAPTVRLGLIVLAIAGVGGMVVVALLAFVPGRLGIFRRLPQHIRENGIVQLLLHTAMIGQHLFRPRPRLMVAALLALLLSVLNCVLFFVLLLGWGVSPTIALGCALLVPAVMEIAMLPISVAGWGVREGTAIVAFGAVGLPAEIAFGSSVLFALIVLAVSLIGGALWMIDRREIGSLETIERETACMDAEALAEKEGTSAG
jgi:glycosyltransferase 2 family protein